MELGRRLNQSFHTDLSGIIIYSQSGERNGNYCESPKKSFQQKGLNRKMNEKSEGILRILLRQMKVQG